MKRFKASVIIPNWNGENLLKDCLKSLREQTFTDFEIILVDNGSEDDSLNYTSINFPEVKIVRLSKNYGFAKAINEGVRNSNADYVVFLNNDTYADKNWLKSLVVYAKKYPKAISINSKLLNYYKRSKIDGVGIVINEVGQARSLGWQEEDKGQYDRAKYIFGATGGASLFKRLAFIKVGLFDENFFMYSEEVDFAFRAQFLGYKSILCPKAIVYHKHKASAKRLPQHTEYWQFRNMYQTIIKNFPTKVILKKWRWLKIILVYFNTIIYQIKNGFFWPPFLVTLYLFFNLPNLIIQRNKIQKSKIVDDQYIEEFFLQKKITFWGLRK